MMPVVSSPPTDTLRRRLEGSAELLEVARLRYRALRLMLRGLLWKEKLRRNAELLRQTAQVQDEVDQLLDRALRRAAAESWPADEPVTRCLHEVVRLRAELTALAARRLRREQAGEPLAELLRSLEAGLAGPRKVPPGQKWLTALEVIPRSLPELRRAGELGDLLERLFSRPMEPDQMLPLEPDEVEVLRRVLPEMDAAMQALWRRLHQCDPSGGLLRLLQRRARRAPLHLSRSGPEELLRAAFWHDLARARLRRLVEVRLSPAQVTGAELLDVVAWLVRHERDPAARLPASSELADSRAGLLELAYELWQGRRQEFLSVRPGTQALELSLRRPPGLWERILERARRADGPPQPPDADRIREALLLRVRLELRFEHAAGPFRDRSLEAAVLLARESALMDGGVKW